MSNKDGTSSTPVGSGPGGRIEIEDIRAKLGEIRGDVEEVTDKAKPMLTYAAVGAGILVIILAFVLGKKRGKRKATWVEIRRL
jgi:hypothetical protein